MKKKLTRITALLLALVMLFAFAACGKSGDDDDLDGDKHSSGNKNDKNKDEGIKNNLKGVEKVRLDHVYKAKPLSVDMSGDQYFNSMTYLDGKVYLVSNYYNGYTDEDGMWVDDSGTKIYAVDIASGQTDVYADFKNAPQSDEPQPENTYSYTYTGNHEVAKDGSVWYTKSESFEDYSDPENYIYEETVYLVKADKDGNESLSFNLSEQVDEEYFYAGNFFFVDDSIVISNGDSIYVFTQDGKLDYKIELGTDTWINTFAISENGDFVCSFYSYDQVDFIGTYKLARLDFTTRSFVEIAVPEGMNLMSLTFMDGPDSKVYMRNNSSVFEYDVATNTMTEKLNWMNSDINSYRLRNVFALENDEFFVAENTRDYSGVNFYHLTPLGDSEAVEKYLINLAAVNPYDDIRDSILEFNKQSEEFRIILKDYSEYNTEGNWEAGLEKLNQDMISGQIPDILIADGLPLENYASKGLLADIYKFMDKDGSFDRSKYLENVFESTTLDGKLFSIIPSFTVFTLVGKTENVGADMGWTIEDLKKVWNQYPDAEVIAEETRGNVLRYFSSMAMSSFVNYDTGECKFNSPDFVGLLEFINTFPEEIDWESYYDDLPSDYWETFGDRFRDNKVLLQTAYVSYFDAIKDFDYNFGGSATFIGFPCPDGIGASIQPNGEIAISSKTKMPGACWDFVKVMLSKEYQDDIPYGFPVHKDVLESKLAEAMKSDEVEEIPGVETLPADDIATEDVIIDGIATGDLDFDNYWARPLTQVQADKLMALITTVNTVQRDNTELLAIIEEEAGAYFAGQKSAQAVADAIQSRAWLYVSENS